MESEFQDHSFDQNLKLTGQGLYMQNKDLLHILGQTDERKSSEKPLISLGINKYLPFLDELEKDAKISMSVASQETTSTSLQAGLVTPAITSETFSTDVKLSKTEMDLVVPKKAELLSPGAGLRRVSSSPAMVKQETSPWFIEKLKPKPNNDHSLQQNIEELQTIAIHDSQIGQLEKALGSLLVENKNKEKKTVSKSEPSSPQGSPKNKRKEMEAYSAQVKQVGINRYGRMFRHRQTSGGGPEPSPNKSLGNIIEHDDDSDFGAGMRAHKHESEKSHKKGGTFTRFLEWATTSPTQAKTKEVNFLAPTSF